MSPPYQTLDFVSANPNGKVSNDLPLDASFLLLWPIISSKFVKAEKFTLPVLGFQSSCLGAKNVSYLTFFFPRLLSLGYQDYKFSVPIFVFLFIFSFLFFPCFLKFCHMTPSSSLTRVQNYCITFLPFLFILQRVHFFLWSKACRLPVSSHLFLYQQTPTKKSITYYLRDRITTLIPL